MTLRMLVFCLLFVVPAGEALAESGSTRIIEIIGERSTEERPADASAPVRVVAGKPCGSKADGRFCGVVSRGPKGAVRAYSAPPITVTADRGASVVVTWAASVSCEMRRDPAAADPSALEFAVDLAILETGTDAVDPGEDGAARFARRQRTNLDGLAPNAPATVDVQPVSLTRTFVRKRSGAEEYYVRVEGAFPSGYGACAVSGGAMTAIVIDK